MEIPIFLSARPSVCAVHSGIIRLPPGQWRISTDCLDSEVRIRTSDSPLSLLAGNLNDLPLTVNGPIFVLAELVHRGSEPFINVKALQ